MLLDISVNVKISYNNIIYYKQNGFENINVGDIISVDPKILTKGTKILVHVKCDICGKESIIPYQKYHKNYKKYNIYTCHGCSYMKNKKTNLIRYKTDNPMQNNDIKEKMKKTNNEKYGVDNVFQNEDIKTKIRETNNKNLGVDYPMQNKEIMNKSKQTCIGIYGFDRPSKNEEVKKKNKNTRKNKYNTENYNNIEKIKSTCIEKYGVDNPTKNENVVNNIKETLQKKNLINLNEKHKSYPILDINYNEEIYVINCEYCKSEVKIPINLYHNRSRFGVILCTECNPIGSFSKSRYENELKMFLDSFSIDSFYEKNKNLFDDKRQVDFYFKDKKIAIEINGLYWHSELFKSDKYHYNKTEQCEKLGIQLIHIYEDEWLYKTDIVKSRILNILNKTPNKIFARKCVVKELFDTSLTTNFLNDNHIQGNSPSSVKLGLFYNEEIVSLMTFGNLRTFMNSKSEIGEYELLRFCSKKYTSVVGAANKLFQYFIKTYNPRKIVTYADRSWSTGDLYERMGFKFIQKTPPNYHYIINNERKHRFGFRKDVLVKQGYDSNKTEHEIMLERKIYRIFNSGNLKYEWLS
jgi:very-short-patch-repair endonuclease